MTISCYVHFCIKKTWWNCIRQHLHQNVIFLVWSTSINSTYKDLKILTNLSLPVYTKTWERNWEGSQEGHNGWVCGCIPILPFEFFNNGWYGNESLGKFYKGTIESSRYGRIKLYFEKHLSRYISLSSQSPYIVAIKMFEAI